MTFSSLVFICIFLPLVFIINSLLKSGNLRNAFLLVASLFFYAWGETVLVFLLIGSVFGNYLLSLLIERRPGMKNLFLVLAVASNLALLGFYKYADFFIDIVNKISGLGIRFVEVGLPIGISFYTFQSMSYTIDVYRGTTKAQRNFLKLLLYVSFFPQLVAGPIIKYHDISQQLDERSVTLKGTAEGIRRFIIGLSKKLLLANTCGAAVDGIYALEPGSISGPLAWLGALAYIFQIYFDFSGYSDMAIGLGHMFGFDFKENFNYPYISQSVQEFWRRWHISLSTWFKEYLYIPLGGNRKGKLRTGINKGIVFFCTGLWHGANGTFVVWGMFHGAFIMLESGDFFKPQRWPRPLRHIYLILIVVISFVIFRSDSMEQAWQMLVAMFTVPSITIAEMNIFWGFVQPSFIITLIICIAASMPLLNGLGRGRAAAEYAGYGVTAVLFLLCMLNLASVKFNPFIYFRF